MSDFFRIPYDPAITGITLRNLAVMVHEAEESGDDISLLQAYDELERRGDNAKRLFMDFYREEWRKRMESCS